MSNYLQHAPAAEELLARKEFPAWTATLDELDDEEGWLLELESPQVYITVKVAEVSVIQRVVAFLNAALTIRLSKNPPFCAETDDLVFGRFGNANVHLLRDNEDFVRCFIMVLSGDSSAIRISLDADSIRALAEALDRIDDPLSANTAE